MPNDNVSQQLEWNEENLAKVIAELYQEAETNETLHRQIMTEPFEVLKSRIDIPEEFRGGVFAREKNVETMMLYVPPYGAAREALPEGTTDEEAKPDFQILCTALPPW